MRKLVVCVTLSFTAAVAAQEPAKFASLPELWRVLEAQNLSLRQLEQTVRSAELEVRARQAARLPSLAGTGSYSYVSEIARFQVPLPVPPGASPPEIEAGVKNQYDLSLTAKQPLFTGFRLRDMTRLAERRREGVEVQKQVLRNQLRLQSGRLYYQILLNRMQQQVMRAGVERLDLQQEAVRNLFLAEQATAFDTLEVYNRRLQLRNQLLRLQRLEEILLSRMKHLLNQREAVEISTPPLPAPQFARRTLEDCREQALARRPELQQFRLKRQMQDLQIRIARSALFPQLAAVAGVHYGKPGVNFFENQWMTYYTFGLQMQWSLWNWGQNRARVQQAQAEAERLALEEQALVQQILQEVEEAFRNRQNALEQFSLQQHLVSLERERYARVRRQFEQGLSAQINLRQAETQLTEAELLLQRDAIEAYLADLQLQYATGSFEENF